MGRVLFWVGVASALIVPLALFPSVGINETWLAFDRYTNLLIDFPERHQLTVPSPVDKARDYAAFDAQLVRWHAGLVSVYEAAASMAVVGQLSSSDFGLEFHWHRQAGAERRALKHDFYAPRDLSLLAYLAASVLAYSSRSVPLALLVLLLNVVNLGICIRLKALTDALSKSVEQLQGAEQAFLSLPLEAGSLQLQQQALCLQKLRAMVEAWDGTQFGYSMTVPKLGSLSVSVMLMASLAAATTVRCSHRILKGTRFWGAAGCCCRTMMPSSVAELQRCTDWLYACLRSCVSCCLASTNAGISDTATGSAMQVMIGAQLRRVPDWKPSRPQQLLPARRLPLPPLAHKGRQGGGARWGNENRLSPGQRQTDSQWLQDSDKRCLRSFEAPDEDVPAPPPEWQRALTEALGRLQYNYFNWRQDTWSDLQLFVVLNSLVFLTGAWVEGAVIRNMDQSLPPPPEGAGLLQTFWYNLYTVLAVVLGQDLPGERAGLPSQLFAIVTAIFGLASFALVLALIEQVVLEVLERNVKRGSMCYEQGHTVVLAWCESARDIAQLTRILTQLCAADRAAGGGTVVVLTQQRGKLEMEQLFREAVPERNRYGTRFVFRQGSPLDPASHRMVAAPHARSVIVCGDNSKRAKESDAQVLRACVLLDELLQQAPQPAGAGPVIVAQIKTADALALVRYACSAHVVPVPTTALNARRYVRLLHHPIAAVFSRCLSDFYSPAHGSLDRCPEVEGLSFAELHLRFPDALVLGLANEHRCWCQLNPPPDMVVQPGDEIITMRPSRWAPGQYRALPEAIHVDPGPWDPSRYVLHSRDEQPLGRDVCGMDSCLAISARAPDGGAQAVPAGATGRPRPGSSSSSSSSVPSLSNLVAAAASLEPYQSSLQGLYLLPVQYSNTLLTAKELLICGWMGQTFMWELLAELDHSDQGGSDGDPRSGLWEGAEVTQQLAACTRTQQALPLALCCAAVQALPAGSQVTLFHEHPWSPQYLSQRCEQHGIRNIEVVHVCGDPRSRCDMQQLPGGVSRFQAAIVVCDSFWADAEEAPDADSGVVLLSQAQMLSLDSAMLMVQLNIRLLLEEAGHPNINIICEKLTYVGVTRFEDDSRLPLGIAVNSASFAAKALTQVQVAVQPRFLQAYMQLGVESDLMVQDCSAFAAEGEELSFLQLQARAASVRQVVIAYAAGGAGNKECAPLVQVILGWYRIPAASSQPLEMVVNPQGLSERSRVRVWNKGDSRCKLVTLAVVKQVQASAEDARELLLGPAASLSSDANEGRAAPNLQASG